MCQRKAGFGALVQYEKTFASQIELTIGSMTMRNSVSIDENTIHIRREQVLNSEVFFDRLPFLNFI
jgi:hypothetical protein